MHDFIITKDHSRYPLPRFLFTCYNLSIPAAHHVFPTPTMPLSICYYVSVPAVHYVFNDLKPRLYVNYFQKLTILSVNTREHSTPNPPFLSRTI